MKLKDSVIITEIDGSYVAVDSDFNNDKFSGMAKLNESGKEILDYFLNDISVDEAAVLQKEKYPEVDLEELREDIQGVVEQFVKIGFFE